MFEEKRLLMLILTLNITGTVIKATEKVQPRPHIIFILVDDAGWNDFSFHGSAQIPTPNTDSFCFNGAVLNSYYSSPLCTPTRGAIFTGKYPIHLGLQHYVIRGDTADGLPLSEKLLPEYLKDLGYSTHLVGKWHLGHFKQVFTPTFRGFDTHYGYWLGSQDYYDHTSTDSGYWGYDFRNGVNLDRTTFGIYNTDLITQESLRVIANHGLREDNEPMFLMITHTAPHVGNDYDPLQAPKENVDKFVGKIDDENRLKYAAMVDKLDESVGDIIKALGENGMLNNSVIVFASDNGGAPEGFALGYASNWPLRGVKNTLWEGGTRVAACIWSPEIQNKRILNDIIHASDWLPTLYEAAGGNTSEMAGIDGVSVWGSLISGEPSPRHEFLYNIDDIYNNSAIRSGPWKLIQGNTSTHDLGGGIWDGWYGYYPQNTSVAELIPQILSSKVNLAISRVTGNLLNPQEVEALQRESELNCGEVPFPSVPCNPYTKPCLFNVQEDPCELFNLAEQEIAKVEEMLSLLQTYNATARAIIDLSYHPEANPARWGYTWTNWKDYEN